MGKKLVGLLSVVGMLAGLVAISQAGGTDTFQIKVQVNRCASVEVSTESSTSKHPAGPTAFDFGVVGSSQQYVSNPIYVYNVSPSTAAAIQNYSAYVSAKAGGWTLTTAQWRGTIADEASIAALIANATPAIGDFHATDVLAEAGPGAPWDATHLNPATAGLRYNTTGIAMLGQHWPYTFPTAAPVKMYIGMATPPVVTASGAGQQTFTITVTAY